MKIAVISLGGSLIVPDDISLAFLEKFRQVLKKHSKSWKFIVVCGGGSVARKYINALKSAGKNEFLQSMAGISITRVNARFMTYLFGRDANEGIPHDMGQVAGLLRRHNVVFCGALRYAPKETSDGTAAKLSRFFKCDFINLTNVQGLYDKNPAEDKNARFIPQISKKELYQKVMKIKFKPGQHFVIDQHAMRILLETKNNLHILGNNLINLDNLLSGKKFIGTTVSN